jgi:2-phosphosulfolactate phosphatase
LLASILVVRCARLALTPTPYDQHGAACRCDWGVPGLHALAPADVVVIVDVLSFSTCVAVAAGRGAAILPYEWKDASAASFAKAQGAELAGDRGTARYSLSPLSFVEAPAGLRCVLPSPNGAALALRAASTPAVVFAGCLRNASAVAEAARRAGTTFNVCPAGERWPDGSLRPAIEDWLAAGAILRWLPGSRSPEAETAVAAFVGARHTLADLIARSSSGRELAARGYERDAAFAAEYDADVVAPRLEGGAFV